nr:hypothetical protein GZ26E7_23 [uncultured archaeon GZfos26E7]
MEACLLHFPSRLPSPDPHVSRKHEQPDRKEHGSRQFRDRGAWGWSIESRLLRHVAPARIVSPVVDACVDSRLVVRAPPVAGCAHIIGLVVHELPLVAAGRVVVHAVCDDVVSEWFRSRMTATHRPPLQHPQIPK